MTQQQPETKNEVLPSNTTVHEGPTISSLDHVLPLDDIEQILDTELGTEVIPVIKMFIATPPHNITKNHLVSTNTFAPNHNGESYEPETMPNDSDHVLSTIDIKNYLDLAFGTNIVPMMKTFFPIPSVKSHNKFTFASPNISHTHHSFFELDMTQSISTYNYSRTGILHTHLHR